MKPVPNRARSRFARLPVSLAAALVLMLPALPAAAGKVYRIERDAKLIRGPGNEVTHEERDLGILYVGASQVRFDQGDKVSWILDAGRGQLILVRHDFRRYHVMSVPFELEDYAKTPHLQAIVADRKGQALVGIETSPRPEKRRIGEYETTRVDLGGHSPDGANRYEYELWMSSAMGGDAALYAALLREFGSADLLLRPIARRLAEVPGFPVLRRSVAYFPEGRLIDERKLVTVEEKDLPASTFEPPAGYRLEPFDLEDWLTPK